MYEVRGGILLTISLFPMPTFNLARCHVAALVVVTGKGSPAHPSYCPIHETARHKHLTAWQGLVLRLALLKSRYSTSEPYDSWRKYRHA